MTSPGTDWTDYVLLYNISLFTEPQEQRVTGSPECPALTAGSCGCGTDDPGKP